MLYQCSYIVGSTCSLKDFDYLHWWLLTMGCYKQKHWCLGQTPRDSWLNWNDWSLGTSIFLYAPQEASLVAQRVRNLPANWETWVRSGRSPGGGDGNPLQYSCLENPHGQRSLAGYNPCSRRVGHDWATKYSTAWRIVSCAWTENYWLR